MSDNLLELENNYNFSLSPIHKKKYKEILEFIEKDFCKDLLKEPTLEKMKEMVRNSKKSLSYLEHYYYLPFLSVDFSLISFDYLYENNRLSKYLRYFYLALKSVGVSRSFRVYMLDHQIFHYENKEGFQSEVLTKILSSVQNLWHEPYSVQVAYTSMIIERVLRIYILEFFYDAHKKNIVTNFDFQEINARPLNRLLDTHCEISKDIKKPIYKCLLKEDGKLFALNLEFRKLTKAILVDKTKWSIRNRYVHSSFETDNVKSHDELRIVELYLKYFILKHNTSLLNSVWEYIEDNFDILYPNKEEN